jgi:hypothetical protein
MFLTGYLREGYMAIGDERQLLMTDEEVLSLEKRKLSLYLDLPRVEGLPLKKWKEVLILIDKSVKILYQNPTM